MTERPARFKTRSKIFGGHQHITVFVNSSFGDTWQNAGKIILSPDEAKQFLQRLSIDSHEREEVE